jgi:hypothetical protein
MTSAPSRRSRRTPMRTSSRVSTSSAMPLVGSNPHGAVRSPWPPVWLSTRTAVCRRGPVSNPAAPATLNPDGSPPRSRAVVMPASRVRRMRSAALKVATVGSSRNLVTSLLADSIPRWTWPSMKPGRTVRPAPSSTSTDPRLGGAPSAGPAYTILPASTRMTAPCSGPAPVPSTSVTFSMRRGCSAVPGCMLLRSFPGPVMAVVSRGYPGRCEGSQDCVGAL